MLMDVIPDTKLELRDIRLVRAIESAGGVTAAAKWLSLTQSAVSHQLRHLEERLEVEIFERIGKKLRITHSGRRLLELYEQVFLPVTALEADLKNGQASRKIDLRVATQCYTAYGWLPIAMKRLAEEHPNVRIQLVPNATPDPISALLSGELDLAVAMSPEANDKLSIKTLFGDELVLIFAPSHALARKSWVDPELLVDETMLLYSMVGDQKRLSRLLFPNGGGFRRVTRLPLTEAIIELVKAGMGLGILPAWAVATAVQNGELVQKRLSKSGLKRKWHAVSLKKNSELSDPIATLVAALKGAPPR